MVNYTNVNDNMIQNISGELGGGFNTLLGNEFVVGIFAFIIMIILGYTMKLDTNTLIVSSSTMLFILVGTYLPEWFLWLTMIFLGIYGGVIFSRIIHK